MLRFLFNTTRARARMVRTPKQKHERAHQMRGGAEVRPEFQLRPRRRARLWQQFPTMYSDTCRAHGPRTVRHVRCLVPTLENVPQLARVVRCVVRVLYTL